MIDVARVAGVSHQTVSRYFKAPEGLKARTAERVSAAVAELGYQPDLLARSMRTGRSGRLAIVLPDSTGYVPIAMLRGAAVAAADAGYTIDVAGIGGSARERLDNVRRIVAEQRVEGVLSLIPLEGLGEQLTSGGVDVVVAPAFDDEMHTRGAMADANPVAEIVDYLADLGHRRLAHIAGPQQWVSALNRREAYIQAVARRGLESVAIVDSDWTSMGGYRAAECLDPASGITAVVAANDQIALGAMRSFRQRGIRIPDDLSIFGWNDEEFTSFLTPSLSTVRVDLEALGERLMQMLLRRVHDDLVDEPVDLRPSATLILRESTAAAPH